MGTAESDLKFQTQARQAIPERIPLTIEIKKEVGSESFFIPPAACHLAVSTLNPGSIRRSIQGRG